MIKTSQAWKGLLIIVVLIGMVVFTKHAFQKNRQSSTQHKNRLEERARTLPHIETPYSEELSRVAPITITHEALNRLCSALSQYSDWIPLSESNKVMIGDWYSYQLDEEINNALEQMGFNVGERKVYLGASKESLEVMANSGDALANLKLIHDYYSRTAATNDVEYLNRKYGYCKRAVEDGYFAQIGCLMETNYVLFMNELEKGQEQREVEKLKSYKKDYRAWQHISQKYIHPYAQALMFQVDADAMDEVPLESAELTAYIKMLEETVSTRQLGQNFRQKSVQMPRLIDLMFEDEYTDMFEKAEEIDDACFSL